MRHALLVSAVISIAILSACKKADEAPPADAPETMAVPDETILESSAATIDVVAWAGKWTGPEGMYVTVTPAADGKVTLEMQSDLDTKGSYEGAVTAEGISFIRGEETLTLKKSTGDETGLKWLAGKKDCLMVKSGEGYCRD